MAKVKIPLMIGSSYVGGYEVELRQVSAVEAEYSPYGASEGRGCAACQWWVAPNQCLVVAGENISPTGISRFFQARIEPTADPIPVVIVEASGSAAAPAASGLKGAYQNVLGMLGMRDLPSRPSIPEVQYGKLSLSEGAEGDAFTPPGRLRYWAVASNNFYDNKGKEFPSAAQQEYVDWVWTDPANNMSELQLWHTPGTRLGQDDWVDYDGHFLHSTGLIDVGREELAKKYAADPAIAMSHGYFVVWDEQDRAIAFRSYEKSILPREDAGNSFTSFGLGGKSEMFSDKKKAFLRQAGYSDADIAARETRWEQFGTIVEQMGIGFHELTVYVAAGLAENDPDLDPAADLAAPVVPAVVPAAGTVTAAAPVAAQQAAAAVPLPTDSMTLDGLQNMFSSLLATQLQPLQNAVHELQTAGMSLDERAASQWAARAQGGVFRASSAPASVVGGQQALGPAANPAVAQVVAAGVNGTEPGARSGDPTIDPTSWMQNRLKNSNGAFAALSPLPR